MGEGGWPGFDETRVTEREEYNMHPTSLLSQRAPRADGMHSGLERLRWAWDAIRTGHAGAAAGF